MTSVLPNAIYRFNAIPIKISMMFFAEIKKKKSTPKFICNLKGPQAAKTIFNKNMLGASLVAQWLRICLPMQGTRVRALVWEDPTCRGAAGPVSHNC